MRTNSLWWSNYKPDLHQALKDLGDTCTAIDQNSNVKPENLVYFVRLFTRCLQVMSLKDKTYGSSWEKPELGHRSNFVSIFHKMSRLKNLIWEEFVESPPHRAKILETLQDTLNYMMFYAKSLESEHGHADLTAVLEQCLESDHMKDFKDWFGCRVADEKGK